VSEPEQGSSHWAALNEHAGLGLPGGRGERHRLARRIVARLGRPFLGHQVAYNRELLAELVNIRDSLAAQTSSLSEAAGAQFGALVERLGALVARVDVLEGRLDEWTGVLEGRLEAAEARADTRADTISRRFDELCRRFDEDSIDRDLIHAEVELAQQHTIEHIREALADVREELRELASAAGDQGAPPATPGGGAGRA
jgi:chromosome segregation ATPase